MTSNIRAALAARHAGRAALVAGALFVVLAAPGPALAEDFAFDGGDSGSQVTVEEGSTLVIELPSNASTGYTWIVATEPDPTVLLAGPTSGEYTAPEGDLVGAEGLQTFTYEAVIPGSTWLLLHYVAPGTKEVGDVFELFVDVGTELAPASVPSADSPPDEMPATAATDPTGHGTRGTPNPLVAVAIGLVIALASGSLLAGLDRMTNRVPVRVDPIDAHRRRPDR